MNSQDSSLVPNREKPLGVKTASAFQKLKSPIRIVIIVLFVIIMILVSIILSKNQEIANLTADRDKSQTSVAELNTYVPPTATPTFTPSITVTFTHTPEITPTFTASPTLTPTATLDLTAQATIVGNTCPARITSSDRPVYRLNSANGEWVFEEILYLVPYDTKVGIRQKCSSISPGYVEIYAIYGAVVPEIEFINIWALASVVTADDPACLANLSDACPPTPSP